MSFFSDPRPLEEIRELIFRKDTIRGLGSRISGPKDPRLWAGLLFLIMILLYMYFA
jgi:hypothetical protein